MIERPGVHASAYPPGGGPAGSVPPAPGGYGPPGPQRPSFEGRPSAMKKSGGGWAVILGGGCAIVVIAGAIVAVVVLLVARAGTPTPAAPAPTGAPVPGARVVARDVRELRDVAGRLAFVAELQNGGSPVGTVSARLRLLSASREVAGATCTPALRLLPAGDKVPCTFSFAQAPGPYDRTDVVVDARAPPAILELASLVVTRSSLGRPASGAEVDGTLSNQGTFAARSVAVLVSFYGADGKIVGAGTFQLGRELRAGTSVAFTVVADVAAPVRTFNAKAVGYRD